MRRTMDITRMSRSIIIATAMLLSSVSKAYDGRVIDSSTGRPAAGIFVIGHWDTGGGFVVPSSGCMLAVKQTNARGEFSLVGGDSGFGRLFGPRDRPATYFYARGYREQIPEPSKEGEPFLIVPDTRSALERLEYISDILTRTDCGTQYVHEHRAVLLPLYRALHEEASEVATTPVEKRLARITDYWLDVLELGPTAAWEKAQRENKPQTILRKKAKGPHGAAVAEPRQ